MDYIPWPELIGKILVNCTIQASLGNIELTSRLLIRKFITTQEDADAFISSVHGYMFIGTLWMIGTTFLMYEMHEYLGAGLNLIFQLMAMQWIISRRYSVYLDSVRQHNLQIKSLISF